MEIPIRPDVFVQFIATLRTNLINFDLLDLIRYS